MQVILLEDVEKLGKRGDLCDVKDGYAYYLMRRRVAVEASKGAIALIETQQRAKQRREAEAKADAEALATLLETRPVSVAVKCGGNGRLFGTVTNANVAEAILRDFAVEVDRHKIDVPENIKSLGTYPIVVKLGKSITATASLQVVAA